MLHLGLWMLTTGHHIASWRHPDSTPSAVLGLDFYLEAARIAEAGKFDMVFFEDTLAARERNGHVFGEVSIYSLDPLISIAALSLATRNIGLASSYSTTYHSVQHAVAGETGQECKPLIKANQLLRQHGQERCKLNAPLCRICPVTDLCAYYRKQRYPSN